MQTFAMVRDGVVMEIVKIPANTPTLEERYHPDLIPDFVELSGPGSQSVADGWLYDGSTFSAPPAAPPDPTPMPAKIYTRRRHIWERATDDECAILTGTLQQANDRLSQIFLSSDWIDHDSEWFPSLQASIVQALGQERADALLAPSAWPEV